MKKVSLGFSSCPNDTFIFYALMHAKVPTHGMTFDPVIDDVEVLNTMAMKSALDVTKVSYHAFGLVRYEYCLLRSGGALGRGCGPLIVSRGERDIRSLTGKTIAVPGKYTTAFLLLLLLNPELGDHVVMMPFDRIMEAVRDGEVDAGVIIHESRFTYPLYGLTAVLDLGQWWEKETSLPLPLGAVVARRRMGADRIRDLESVIRESIHYSRRNREEALPYIRDHAQEIADDVIEKHINLYVNDFSIDVGGEGVKAIQTLFRMAEEKNVFKKSEVPLFPD